jgi:hypothetical protein
MSLEKDRITYLYRFKFVDGSEKEFVVKLDSETLNIITENNSDFPEWAKLENFKCPVCSLDPKVNEYCPVAANLSNVIEGFKDSRSYETANVIVETDERNFSKHTSLQEGINSLIGIYMVRNHLPFSTLEERRYRVLSMYLLAQFLLKKKGGYPDWDFKDLIDIFENVRVVNKNFCEKLSKLSDKDATINALITLDSFAFYTSFHISRDMLNVLEPSFDGYLRDIK